MVVSVAVVCVSVVVVVCVVVPDSLSPPHEASTKPEAKTATSSRQRAVRRPVITAARA